MKNLLVTTTNSIEGKEINKYFSPITASAIIGTNVFSDLKAGLSDFFGGRSNTYEKRVQKLYDIALEDIKRKTVALGANAIIGMQMQTNEISGKNTQMFQVSVYGTPVLLSDVGSGKIERVVDGKTMDAKIRAMRLLKIDAGKSGDALFTTENLELIASIQLPELLPIVLKGVDRFTNKEERINYGPDNADAKLNYLYQYFNDLDNEEIIIALYDKFETSDNTEYLNFLFNTISSSGIFDSDKINMMLASNKLLVRKYGLKFIAIGKDSYSTNDVSILNDLKRKVLEQFEVRATITTKKKMLSSAEKQVWECECGKTNDMEAEYCGSCNNDMYGFTREEVKPNEAIELLDGRVAIINSINE